MVHPMIDPAFSPFGIVRQFQAPEDNPSIPLLRQEVMALYRFDRDTDWDYRTGMTMLLIREPEGDVLFYLDRPVTIHAGICFGFFPMLQESVITGNAALLTEVWQVDTAKTPTSTAPIQPLEIFTFYPQTGRNGLYFRGEQHAPVELVYLLKGTLHNYCGGRDLVLHPNELLFFGADQWHMQYAEEEVQFLTVSFLWAGHDLSDWANQVIPASREMQQAVQAMLLEYRRNLPDRDEFLHAQLKLLLLQILRQPAPQDKRRKASPAAEQMHREILNRAQQVVSARIFNKLTVSSLAAAVNVSASQLTALFQTYLGISPAKYITRIRLEESKALLTGKQMNVSEVATRLGYASVPHFSKQFRDWVGCSPTAYVRNVQETKKSGVPE